MKAQRFVLFLFCVVACCTGYWLFKPTVVTIDRLDRPGKAATEVLALANHAMLHKQSSGGSCPEDIETLVDSIAESYRHLTDPWKRPYVYTVRANEAGDESCLIVSFGKDGLPGGWGHDRDHFAEVK